MITRFKKPDFIDIGSFAKHPNRIDATQHYWDLFIGNMRSRFMETVYFCERILTDPKSNAHIRTIRNNNLNAVQVLDAMASSIRLDLSSVKARKKQLRLYEWLTAFIRLFGAVNNLKDGDIRLDVSPEIKNSIIITDEILLQQVIYHLIFNASTLGNIGSHIDIICKTVEGHLIIEICHGESGDTAAKQTDWAPFLWDKTDVHDTGRSLYICSLYMEAMSGTISVENRDNATVFFISIPQMGHMDAGVRA